MQPPIRLLHTKSGHLRKRPKTDSTPHLGSWRSPSLGKIAEVGIRDAAIMGRARSCWTGFIEVRPECELYDQLMAHETLAKVIERSAPGFQYHFKAVTGTPQIQFWKQLQLQEEARPLEGMLCLPCSEPGGSTLVATAANQPAKTFRSALSQHSGHQIHPL